MRQGLKKAESVLLEPYYEFRIELPSENVGRAMTDIQNRFGKFEAPETLGEMTVLTGIAPVSTLSGYQKDVIAYTGGRGRISLTLKGYDLCHNQEEVVAARGYDSELDLANPTGSVFCAHGAGFVVDWDEVEEYMHMERTLDQTGEEGLAEVTLPKRRHSSIELTQEELDAIYVRTPDPVKQNHGQVTVCAKEKDREPGSAYTGSEICIRDRCLYRSEMGKTQTGKGRPTGISSGGWIQYHFLMGGTKRAVRKGYWCGTRETCGYLKQLSGIQKMYADPCV